MEVYNNHFFFIIIVVLNLHNFALKHLDKKIAGQVVLVIINEHVEYAFL